MSIDEYSSQTIETIINSFQKKTYQILISIKDRKLLFETKLISHTSVDCVLSPFSFILDSFDCKFISHTFTSDDLSCDLLPIIGILYVKNNIPKYCLNFEKNKENKLLLVLRKANTERIIYSHEFTIELDNEIDQNVEVFSKKLMSLLINELSNPNISFIYARNNKSKARRKKNNRVH